MHPTKLWPPHAGCPVFSLNFFHLSLFENSTINNCILIKVHSDLVGATHLNSQQQYDPHL